MEQKYKGLVPRKYQDAKGNIFFTFVDPDPAKRSNPGNGRRFDDVSYQFGFYRCVDFIKGIPERVISEIVYIDEESGVLFDQQDDLGVIGRHVIRCSKAQQQADDAILGSTSSEAIQKISANRDNFFNDSINKTYKEIALNVEKRKAMSSRFQRRPNN